MTSSIMSALFIAVSVFLNAAVVQSVPQHQSLFKRQLDSISVQKISVSKSQDAPTTYEVTAGELVNYAKEDVQVKATSTLDFGAVLNNAGTSDQSINSVSVSMYVTRWDDETSSQKNIFLASQTLNNLNLVAGELNTFTVPVQFPHTLIIPRNLKAKSVSAKSDVAENMAAIVKSYKSAAGQKNLNPFSMSGDDATLWQFHVNLQQEECIFYSTDSQSYFNTPYQYQFNATLIRYEGVVSVNSLLDSIGIKPQFDGYFIMYCF
ncbi:hypothetical protein MP228_009450 [Amoeboaphelidium protococcarum]|nr:hypothetical protein MP228_009450 [Amoeboaphelidium protococcarum]